MPFEIPESWVWTSIGELFEHNTGKALNASNRDGKMMDYITTSNLYWDRFDLSVVKQMWFTEEELWRCTAKKGDLLICEGGDIGRAAIWNYDYDIRIQNHIHRLRGYKGINHRFYYFVFLLYKLSNRIGGKGVAIQGLSSGDLHKLEVPLPPEYEQIRLVKTIEKWFKFVDLLEQEQENLHTLVQSTKSKILDLAISGKLVPQDPNDEPAIELLRRINPAFKPCDNSHYENLPQGWTIVGLHSVAEIITGSTPSKLNAEYYNGDVPFYKPNDLDQGRHVRCASEYLSQQGKSISRSIPCNSIAVCCIGSIGKCGFIEKEGVTNQQINTIVPNDAIFPLYMYYFCNSSTFIDELKSLSSAVTISIVNKSKLSTIQIPLPPIAEQKRIISVIEKLYSHLDMITAEL